MLVEMEERWRLMLVFQCVGGAEGGMLAGWRWRGSDEVLMPRSSPLPGCGE